MSDWRKRRRYPPPPPRRPAKDGIASRSRRGQFGETWWSRRFVDALERICEPKRLHRGRSYARSGQVSDLEVEIGQVTAFVQGTKPRPYHVRIKIDAFDEDGWTSIEDAMAEQALFLASLLAGEMPREIEEAFIRAGRSLFPSRMLDLRGSCSCPDAANPCKHVAATLYILAERFDLDPFEIFLWRGRSKAELMLRLRERRETAGPGEETATGDLPASAPADRPLSESLATFWVAGDGVAGLPLSPHAPTAPDAALRELGDPPAAIGGAPLGRRLSEMYQRVTREAERRAFE